MMDSAAALAAQVHAGRRSAAEILTATEARIRAVDPRLNCFTATTFERARREADAIDRQRAAGVTLPPLAGVPYAVKNLYDIEGMVTLCGGKINEANPAADKDAVLVERMRAAGAILVGALNMDEHAYGFTTENTHYGATRNPYDSARIAGGSSGGSAAAVAAGMVPLTLGSDTNGSIRVPSSLCGVFGLKPTYGRLPRSGTFPFVQSFDHLGPFARNAADLIACYNALQGHDPLDHANARRPVQPVQTAPFKLGALRVGVLGGWFIDWAEADARLALRKVAAAFGTTRTVELHGAQAARSAAFVIGAAEGGSLHRQRLITQYADFEPLSRDRLVAGSVLPASWVQKAHEVRYAVYQEALALFSQFDVLLAPSTPVCAPPIGTEELTINGSTVPARASLGLLTQPISCIGLPVCSVPVWTGGPLPIGVQLIAAPWREDLCLGAAHALELAGVAEFRAPSDFA